MRENLFGCLTLSRHALGAALAHSHTVAPASAGQEGPLIVQFHDLADSASEFSARGIEGQAEVLGPDEIALSR